MKRIVIYARGHVTREEQVRMEDFAASIPSGVVTKVYWDHDGSNRSEFRALISAARDGSVDAIIAQSICRFSPDANECLKLVQELHQGGIHVYFSREHFWSTGLTAWLSVAV